VAGAAVQAERSGQPMLGVTTDAEAATILMLPAQEPFDVQ
jgi:hypothetical protein